MAHILVVEDDRKLNHIICTYLTDNGYHTTGCCNSVRACDVFSTAIPILLISSSDDIISKKKGFDIGIDDYMVKPFDMDELVLRVGALLRRAQLRESNKLEVGNLSLVQDEMSVYIGGDEVPVAPREFQLLYKLLSHPKKIFTRSELLGEYWGMASDTGLRTVDVYITKLRRMFKKCTDFEIVTVHGFGYKAVLK